MNRCTVLAVMFACALLGVGPKAFAQTEPAQSLADRIGELEASRQGVLLPLNGALDPEVAEQPEAPPEPETQAAAPQAPSVILAPQSDAGVPPSPPLENAQSEGEAPADGTDEPTLADLPAETPPVEEEAPAVVEDDAAAAMLPDLDGIDGLVVAELGNPDSIGPYRLWLASFRTVREAQAGWQQLAKDNRDVLGDLVPVIVMKELGGDSGTFFRLQAGPLSDEAQAESRCETLKSRTLYCAILGPDEG